MTQLRCWLKTLGRAFIMIGLVSLASYLVHGCLSKVDLKSLDLTEDTFNAKLYVEQFVKIMNQTGKEIGMKETNYINPHGLDSNFKL